MIGSYDTLIYQMNRIRYPVFEGEGDGSGVGAGAAAGDDGAAAGTGTGIGDASTTVVPPTTIIPPSDGGTGLFNADQQKELNRILAGEKKKHQKVVQKAVDEANALRSKAQLTANERSELDNRLEQIQNQMRTKEEQAKRAQAKLEEEYTTEKATLVADRDTWKGLFTKSTIERSITDAAASNNAFSPGQIVAILGPNTTLVAVLDEEGKPTGDLEPKVRFRTKDKEGKPVTLDLSPSESVKRMKDEEEYLNLFRGEGSGGAGLRSQPGGKKADVSQLAKDPAAYRKARKEGKISFD